MADTFGFFDRSYDTRPCGRGWHLCFTIEEEPVYFRFAGKRGHYLIAKQPDTGRTKLVVGEANEPWLCVACATFVGSAYLDEEDCAGDDDLGCCGPDVI